jgi:hypothetical protein
MKAQTRHIWQGVSPVVCASHKSARPAVRWCMLCTAAGGEPNENILQRCVVHAPVKHWQASRLGLCNTVKDLHGSQVVVSSTLSDAGSCSHAHEQVTACELAALQRVPSSQCQSWHKATPQEHYR